MNIVGMVEEDWSRHIQERGNMKYFTVHYDDAMAGYNTLSHALSAVRFGLRIQGIDAVEALRIINQMRAELVKHNRPHSVNHGAITLRTWACAADAHEVLRYEEQRAIQEQANGSE